MGVHPEMVAEQKLSKRCKILFYIKLESPKISSTNSDHVGLNFFLDQKNRFRPTKNKKINVVAMFKKKYTGTYQVLTYSFNHFFVSTNPPVISKKA